MGGEAELQSNVTGLSSSNKSESYESEFIVEPVSDFYVPWSD